MYHVIEEKKITVLDTFNNTKNVLLNQDFELNETKYMYILVLYYFSIIVLSKIDILKFTSIFIFILYEYYEISFI